MASNAAALLTAAKVFQEKHPIPVNIASEADLLGYALQAYGEIPSIYEALRALRHAPSEYAESDAYVFNIEQNFPGAYVKAGYASGTARFAACRPMLCNVIRARNELLNKLLLGLTAMDLAFPTDAN